MATDERDVLDRPDAPRTHDPARPTDPGQRAAPPPHAPEQDEPPRPHGDPNAPLVPGHQPPAT